MIWLAWRQFRTPAVVALSALALVAIYLIHLGSEIRGFHDLRIADCAGEACHLARMDMRATFSDAASVMTVMLIAVPGLIGAFWGAPLVAQELEQRTDALVWNQSITRTRWLAVKLAVVGLAAAAVTGLFSLMLTWSVSPYDDVVGERFAALSFSSRNVVPIGYALLALVLGTMVGIVARRTLPAMAITLVVFAGVQLLVPSAVREHLMPPVTKTVNIDADVLAGGVGMNLDEDDTFDIQGYAANGTWALQFSSPIYKPDSTPYRGQDAAPCLIPGDRAAGDACTAAQNLHFQHTYQPGDRYWTFQWIELTAFLGLSVILGALGFVRLRRRT
ncbi:MAG: ABC transporter permease subunit [Phycicoccus sp.]